METLKSFLLKYAELKTMEDEVLKVCYSGDEEFFEFLDQICDVHKFEEGHSHEGLDLALLVGPKSEDACAWENVDVAPTVVLVNCSVNQDNFAQRKKKIYQGALTGEDCVIYTMCEKAMFCFQEANGVQVGTTIPPEPTVIEEEIDIVLDEGEFETDGEFNSSTTLPPQDWPEGTWN